MKLSGSEIKQKAIDIIKQHPDGIGPTALLKIIQPRHPETKNGTIRGAVWKLDQDFPEIVGKGPSGYYMLGKGAPRPPAKAPKLKAPKAGKAPRKAASPKREKKSADRVTREIVKESRDQDAEMQGLRAQLAKVQKAVCG